MRLQCSIEGFEQCYLEISDRWTRKEMRDFRTANLADTIDLFKAKITGVHIECADGNHITTVEQMTDERLDQVDSRVYFWMPGALTQGLKELETLGFLAGLRRYDITGENSTQANPSPASS